MFNRFRNIAQYATLKQLYRALALDAFFLSLLSASAMTLLLTRHPFYATPLLLITLVEGVTTGLGIYLIVERHRQA